MKFTRTEFGVYRAVGRQFIYRAYRDGRKWIIDVHKRLTVAGLDIADDHIVDREIVETLTLARLFAKAYEGNSLADEKPYLNRATRATLSAYA